MKEYRLTDWLPTTKKEVELRGWDELDVILFSGDAYVDHPSFGAAVIGRILEAEGLRVAIVPQPNWRDDLRDFKKLGRPRLFFGVSAGCMDSMVNKYTANKRLRSDDAYTPDARPDMRPEYPSIVYTQILKKLYPDVPVILGGIEASMRRLTHYDYWQDRVRPSILVDSGADALTYGMGEKPIVELVKRLNQQQSIFDIPQLAYLTKEVLPQEGDIILFPHEECLKEKKKLIKLYTTELIDEKEFEEENNIYNEKISAYEEEKNKLIMSRNKDEIDDKMQIIKKSFEKDFEFFQGIPAQLVDVILDKIKVERLDDTGLANLEIVLKVGITIELLYKKKKIIKYIDKQKRECI